MEHQTTAESQRFRLLRLTWGGLTFRFVGTDADGYLGVKHSWGMESREAEHHEWFIAQLVGEPGIREDGTRYRSYAITLARRWLSMHGESLVEVPWKS